MVCLENLEFGVCADDLDDLGTTELAEYYIEVRRLRLQSKIRKTHTKVYRSYPFGKSKISNHSCVHGNQSCVQKGAKVHYSSFYELSPYISNPWRTHAPFAKMHF
jgi:hypothetical protein